MRSAIVSLGIGMMFFSAALVPAQKPMQERAPVLVELFTSEGCSSCPPADRLLQQLRGTATHSGMPILVLSEHVTYWNHLGWTDPFSSDAATERQSDFGRHFHLDSVYTPQIVINGRDQMVGSNETMVRRALESQPVPSLRLHIGSIHAGREGLTAEITASGSAPRGILYAVVAQDMASVPVPRGENSGRQLHHVDIARSITRVGTLEPSRTVDLHLKPSALQSTDGKQRHLVVFAQADGAADVLAAASASF